MLSNSTLLITGGTGSFGNAFVSSTLKRFSPRKIIIYSRDEMKQWEMAMRFDHDDRIKFVIGDVRDKDRLKSSLLGVNYVVHAAATKIVPTAEYNPIECIKTNISGAANVIEACIEQGIQKVVALSTDKASNPINLYGATKLASDKLFIAACNSDNLGSTAFSVVRYGNVMGSRGSVIPFFLSKAHSGVLPITDSRMTRFMITLEQGIELVWHAFEDMIGGELYVKKIPSMNILDIARAVSAEAEYKFIGIRPGEKIHEQMIGVEDSLNTFAFSNYYKILPTLYNWHTDPARIKDGVLVDSNFSYTSNTNTDWLSVEDLRKWILLSHKSERAK